ncbi:MAG: tetratricopeptide repeat protein [Thermodesulfobacteriota bacterium]|nr:tetratricopeptide repeat protein [Thermodesulfobacteriota bacterium]
MNSDQRNLPEKAVNLSNIGKVHESKGEFQTAIGYYRKALRIDKEIEYSLGIGSDLHNIGRAHEGLGELEEAMHYYKRAFKFNEKMGIKKRTDQDMQSMERVRRAMERRRD